MRKRSGRVIVKQKSVKSELKKMTDCKCRRCLVVKKLGGSEKWRALSPEEKERLKSEVKKEKSKVRVV